MSNFKRPPVGAIVTVTTRKRDHFYLATSEYIDTVYANVLVLKPYPWAGPNTFCIPAEGEPYIDTRVIDMDCVIDLQVHGMQADRNLDANTTQVEVPGSNGRTYTVTLVGGVAKSCECLGFEYRKQCRHLRQAMGETPVNPRRETQKKRKPAEQLSLHLPQKQAKGTESKADLVRGLIRANKAGMTAETITDMVVTKLGFSRNLASTYVRNNWNKV